MQIFLVTYKLVAFWLDCFETNENSVESKRLGNHNLLDNLEFNGKGVFINSIYYKCFHLDRLKLPLYI